MEFNKTKLFPIALSFISVGLLLAVALFLIFTNQPTVALILGLIAGLTLSMVIVVALTRFISFSKQRKESDKNSFVGKFFNHWGVDASREEINSFSNSVEFAIKSFAASWMLFGSIAIALSTALYYATVLQASQLEQQNSIVTEQNELLCIQNNLASTANKFEMYKITLEQSTTSVDSLLAIKDTLLSSFTRTANCVNSNCISNVDGMQIHEVNSDINLYGRAAFSLQKFEEVLKSWKVIYPKTLGAFSIDDVEIKQQVFSDYRKELLLYVKIIDDEAQKHQKNLSEQRSQLDKPLKECQQTLS
ncbi:MAG: hypothetical protein ACI9LX_004020 [Paraglaciecola sp.]|jgi:hypothetical protein